MSIVKAEVPVYSSTGDQGLQTAGDSLDDGTVMEEGDTSPQPQNRRTRREACTCPFCKDGEARYVTSESVNTTTLLGNVKSWVKCWFYYPEAFLLIL